MSFPLRSCPLEARSGGTGIIRDATHHYREKIHVAKDQLEMMLTRILGAIKRDFFIHIKIATGSIKIIVACYRIRMVTSQTGTGTWQRCLMQSLSSTLMRN